MIAHIEKVVPLEFGGRRWFASWYVHFASGKVKQVHGSKFFYFKYAARAYINSLKRLYRLRRVDFVR